MGLSWKDEVDPLYQYFSENKEGEKIINRGYRFSESYQDKNRYIEEYHSLKESLIVIFGAPKNDQVIWESEGYKGIPSFWGHAIIQEKLKFLTSWERENESIKMMLYGQDAQIHWEIHLKFRS